ncbi:MAG: HAD family hydrolase [Bdellovibrionaceae bacterium]|nr:HAD family hydrolase [Pseudobdellovibrionaceae bacterium]
MMTKLNPGVKPRKAIEIFNKIKDLALTKKTHSVVVFDLDSTLFDVAPRLEKVLIDVADEPIIKEKFPNVIPYFKNIKTQRNDWGFVDVLKRAGVSPDHHDLFKTVRTLWAEKFFSNEYIHHDVPYQGSVEFVKKIDQLQIPIVYLTGRDVKRMELGSRDVLKKWDFPLDDQSSRLVLKPERSMDDALFKRDWLHSYMTDHKTSVFLFENEPVNINLVAKELPTVELVFFDSTHSRMEAPPEEIFTLVHYLLDDE